MSGSAQKLAGLIVGSTGSGVQAGALMYQAEQAKRRNLPSARLLKQMSEEARSAASTRAPAPPRHPQDVAHRKTRRERGPLKPADLAWLARVADKKPAELPYDDAVALAEIRNSLRMEDRSDSRYVDSIWQPVADYHSRRVAQAEIASVKATSVTIPSGALAAVSEALAAELGDQFREDEIAARARELLDQAVASEAAQLYARGHAAQESINRLDAEKATRAEVDR